MDSRSTEKLIEWQNDRYSTDIDRFDEQHKHLFGLLNDLYVAVEEGHSEETVGDILRELERYTEYHFGDEEEFMQDCGYAMDCADCFYEHRQMHEEFTDTVAEFREKHENGEPITVDVLEFARDWLDAHIASSDNDQNYSDYFQQTVPEDYEYNPGKLNSGREGQRTYEPDDEAAGVAIGTDVHVGGAVSIPNGSMAHWLSDVAESYGDRVVARDPGTADSWTYTDLYERARAIAGGLLDAGVEPGTTVGIRAEPSFDWWTVDAACHLAGLVSVPIYPGYSDERAVATEATDAVEVLVTDGDASGEVAEAAGTVYAIDHLPTAEPESLPGFDADYDDVATIVHQLGEGADPLGCAITHRNLLAAVAMLGDEFPVSAGATGTCLLPPSHVFQRVATYYLWDNGASMAFADDGDVVASLQAIDPEVLVGVPSVYEHLYETVRTRLDDLGGMKGRLADGAAVERGRAISAGNGGSLTDSAAARLVLQPIAADLGLDGIEHALCGIGGLDLETLYVLWGIGVPVAEVYGTVETTGVGCVTPHGSGAPDAYGAPMGGTEVALSEEDEIMIRGDNVVDHYWETRDVAVSATQGDWYHTGDAGRFEDGILHPE